jgi:hypothetical protein
VERDVAIAKATTNETSGRAGPCGKWSQLAYPGAKLDQGSELSLPVRIAVGIDSGNGKVVVQNLEAARVEHANRLSVNLRDELALTVRLRRSWTGIGWSGGSLLERLREIVEIRWNVVIEIFGHVIDGRSMMERSLVDARYSLNGSQQFGFTGHDGSTYTTGRRTSCDSEDDVRQQVQREQTYGPTGQLSAPFLGGRAARTTET